MNYVCDTQDCLARSIVFPEIELRDGEVVICGICNAPTIGTEATPWTEEQIRAHVEKVNNAEPAN